MSIREAMVQATAESALGASGGGRPVSIREAMLKATAESALGASGGGRP
jgi:hypothetical protein